jgi:hypothetical protein
MPQWMSPIRLTIAGMSFEMNMNEQELEEWIRSTPGFQKLQTDANESSVNGSVNEPLSSRGTDATDGKNDTNDSGQQAALSY